MSKIDLSDFAKFVGVDITDETTLDDVKTAFNEKYVPVDRHKEVVGSINGKSRHAIGKLVKRFGIEVGKDEIEGVDIHEGVLLAAEKLDSVFNELKSAKSATQEELEKKYSETLSAKEQKIKDLSQLNESLAAKYEGVVTEYQTKERNGKINAVKSQAVGSLPWSDKATSVVKKGFDATIAEKYRFDLEGDSPVVRDKDNNIVQSKSKAGSPATYEEVIASEFDALMGDYKKVADSKKVPNFVPNGGIQQKPNGKPLPSFQPRYI